MNNLSLKLVLTFVLTLSLFSCKSNNKEIAQEPIYRIDSIPFTMNENFGKAKYNKIYIPVQLKDSATYSFILDNCCSNTWFQDNLFNTMYDRSNFHAIDTPSFTASIISFEGHVELKIGSYLFALDTINITNTELFKKLYHMTTDLKGIIGCDLFEREIVEVDFDNHLILIHSHLPEKTATYLTLDLFYGKQFWKSDKMPRVQFDGFVGKNQEKLTGKFLFDLGAELTSLFPEFNAKLSSDMSQYDSLSWGYKLLNLTNVHNQTVIGKFGIPEDERNQGLIGMDFIKQFNLVFDYPRGKIYLQPRENAQPSPYLKLRK